MIQPVKMFYETKLSRRRQRASDWIDNAWNCGSGSRAARLVTEGLAVEILSVVLQDTLPTLPRMNVIGCGHFLQSAPLQGSCGYM